eukprot:CAMPEP_0197825824 /NCGR_PEP_ID=MMETSP1437-20131217/2858_1 /TAXON_ID=49252 ORGANISM="Eucampia antarctica, Strain CCMP1452" /NCGR_SAMPLE_ID=MMETSP1437 /ASSEMBLY_ACC=CAM_ASM_001096 /LENGTH=77 /DNA_ID=CAMNT_0043425991 /DNA_START=46 /DNA_END=279 /DNA_ORIENTATION=-
MVCVPRIITNKTIMSSSKAFSLFKPASSAAAKMGSVADVKTFGKVGAGKTFTFDVTSKSATTCSIGRPFFLDKKVVR